MRTCRSDCFRGIDPRARVVFHVDGEWRVSGSMFATGDETLAREVARVLDEVDPLPRKTGPAARHIEPAVASERTEELACPECLRVGAHRLQCSRRGGWQPQFPSTEP